MWWSRSTKYLTKRRKCSKRDNLRLPQPAPAKSVHLSTPSQRQSPWMSRQSTKRMGQSSEPSHCKGSSLSSSWTVSWARTCQQVSKVIVYRRDLQTKLSHCADKLMVTLSSQESMKISKASVPNLSQLGSGLVWETLQSRIGISLATSPWPSMKMRMTCSTMSPSQ